jgi:predicted transposase/invertase (TIGR01784 family)
VNVNKKYKDSMFSALFSEPEALRELYSAIEGIPLNPDSPIAINTLSEALFMEQINDISFTIGNKLVILIEHQSTINPNMPVRLLIYLGRVYEKILAEENLYSEKALVIPRPEFIVLYNGKTPCPDVQALRLSDLFAPLEGLKPESTPAMDIRVTVYNINRGHNEDKVRHSEILSGYSVFVEQMRENLDKEKMSLSDAMEATIAYCIDHTILSDFLRKYGAEVRNMVLTEWKTEKAKEVWQKEAREDGRVEGREEVARNLLGMGLTPEQVAMGTGLAIDAVREFSAR